VNKVPLMWSEPHFYNADPQYKNAVRGLTPNKTLHESVVVVEPVSVTKQFAIICHTRLSVKFLFKLVSVSVRHLTK